MWESWILISYLESQGGMLAVPGPSCIRHVVEVVQDVCFKIVLDSCLELARGPTTNRGRTCSSRAISMVQIPIRVVQTEIQIKTQ